MARPQRLLANLAMALGALAIVAACTTGSGGAGGAFTQSPAEGGGSQGSSELITRTEIAELPEGSAFTVIRQARPRWLRTRTPGTFTSPGPVLPVVFVDEQRYGPLETLNSIASPNIEEIEFYNARDATTRWGTGYMGGVIHVHTRR